MATSPLLDKGQQLEAQSESILDQNNECDTKYLFTLIGILMHTSKIAI